MRQYNRREMSSDLILALYENLFSPVLRLYDMLNPRTPYVPSLPVVPL